MKDSKQSQSNDEKPFVPNVSQLNWVVILAKLALFTLIFWLRDSVLQATIASLILTILLPLAIGKVNGCEPMPVTDLSTFYSSRTAPVNIMSATFLSVGRPEYAKEVFRAAVNAHPKMRSEIVSILGYLFYKPLKAEDCL